jgi:hypothetical protein
VDSKPTASDRAKARIERLARIKEARRRRLAGLAADPPPDPPTIGAPTEDEFRREVAAVFEGKSPGFSSTFKPIVEELGSGLLDCLQDVPENARGKIHFTLSLIGEPEVGAVVEELEVHTEGNPDESLVTCGRESVYTALLPDPAESLLDTLNLTIDLDDRELSVGAPMTADNLADILDRYPELLSDVESAATLLASQPELAEAFRALREQDPGLAERFPALDEALPE